MTARPWWVGGAAVAAVVVPAAALWYVEPLARHLRPAIVSPFGWWSLMLVQVLASLPLAMVIAAALPKRPYLTGTAVLAAVVGVVLTVAMGASVDPYLDGNDVAFLPRHLIRVGWVLALQVPLCLALLPADRRIASWPGLAVGLLLVAGTAGVAWSKVRLVTDQTATQITEQKYLQALTNLETLCEVGSPLPVYRDRPPKDVRMAIIGQLRRSAMALAARLPGQSPVGAVLDRADMLSRLDLFDDATAALNQLPEPNFDALLMLAGVEHQRGRLDDSDEALRAASKYATNEYQHSRVYVGLVRNARDRLDPREVERLLQEGLAKLPTQRAAFHFHLGRHYRRDHQPRRALDHLAEAVSLDAEQYGQRAGELIAEIRQGGPGWPARGR